MAHHGDTASGEPDGVSEKSVDGTDVLDFSIREGQIYNRFFRQGPVVAHTVLTSGDEPRLVVAFPAGNSGVSLWFKSLESEVYWSDIDKIRGIRQSNRDGEPLYGVETEIRVDAAKLTVDEAVLSSVRVIRNYLHNRDLSDSTESEVSVDDQTATWYRDRLDGRGGYKLSVEVLEGSLAGGQSNTPVVFKAPADSDLRLRVTALSGDKPLAPIEMDDLLTSEAAEIPLAKQVLAFLSYEEKLLAGSWRFCTYFGRDTLMSIRLMMPVLTSKTIEAGLGSVLARLNAEGEVAHEEDIGEFAVLRRGGDGPEASNEPLYDYHMVDDDYMLAPIAAHYLLDHPAGRDRAAVFLRKRMANGQTHGEALVSNLRFVLASALPFARESTVDYLIKLKVGSPAGNWRDSREGLGHGRIPYDVNAVWIPAALDAIARLHESSLLAEYVSADAGFERAVKLAELWTTKAPLLFEVSLPLDEARQRLTGFAESIGVPDQEALYSLHDATAGGDTKLTFNAVSLDAKGNPIPVLNSDDGFALLFGDLSPPRLERIVATLFSAFPAGLLTPVGLVVANPAYASSEQHQLFTSSHYHGMTVWSWHQALLAAGLERQLERSDLPAGTRQRLIDAQARLWKVIISTRALQNSELWSWSFTEGAYRLEPFGQRSDDETESNAAQLWSTVFLGIPAPPSAE
jgi:glycogen debranching enzyme